jgi:hypothetical protein
MALNATHFVRYLHMYVHFALDTQATCVNGFSHMVQKTGKYVLGFNGNDRHFRLFTLGSFGRIQK